jgi:hypothetical protein
MLSSTGEPDQLPSKVSIAVMDIACGLYAHGAIMAALLSCQQTGQGIWIDWYCISYIKCPGGVPMVPGYQAALLWIIYEMVRTLRQQ